VAESIRLAAAAGGIADDEARRVALHAAEEVERHVEAVLRRRSAGATIDKGSTVTLAVAKQPQNATVTDVTGETQDDAVNRLSKDGFQVKIVEQPVDSQEGDGVVIGQDPAGGTAKRGSTVTLTVGRFDPNAAPGQATPTTTTPTTATPTTPTTP